MIDLKLLHSFASKYNSSLLKFKLSNIVMVFSNSNPFTSSLSDDCWLICQIENNELIETNLIVYTGSHTTTS